MTASTPEIGFAGLGALGSALAEQLVKQDCLAAVWNRSPEKSRPFLAQGIVVAEDFEALCETCDWVFSCGADDTVLLELCRQMADCTKKPSLHVSFASCSPGASHSADRLLGANGISFLNAPVMGRPDIVRAGKAAFILAGPDAAARKISPVLELIGAQVHGVGSDPSFAAALKLAMNYLIATTIGALSEAFAVLSGYPDGEETLLEVIDKSPFGSPLVAMFGNLIHKRAFETKLFDLHLARKDLQYFNQMQKQSALLKLGEAVISHMNTTIAASDTPMDWAGLAAHILPPHRKAQ